MKTKTLMITMALIAVTLAPLAMAQPEGRRGGYRGGPRGDFSRGFQGERSMGREMARGMNQGQKGPSLMLGRMADELGLTDEQKAQIKEYTEAAKEKIQTAQEAVQTARKALQEAAMEGTEDQIVAAGKAIGDALTNQALLKANTRKQVNSVLTEEQLAQLEELKTDIKAKMEQRRERRQQRLEEGDGEGFKDGFGPGLRGGFGPHERFQQRFEKGNRRGAEDQFGPGSRRGFGPRGGRIRHLGPAPVEEPADDFDAPIDEAL